jgi:hypothetical protein
LVRIIEESDGEIIEWKSYDWRKYLVWINLNIWVDYKKKHTMKKIKISKHVDWDYMKSIIWIPILLLN